MAYIMITDHPGSFADIDLSLLQQAVRFVYSQRAHIAEYRRAEQLFEAKLKGSMRSSICRKSSLGISSVCSFLSWM